MKTALGIAALMTALAIHQEPKPRLLAGAPVPINAQLETISGARELPDGRLLVTDAARAAVYLVDVKKGTTQQIGSAGGGQTQYAQPGGFYSGQADTVYLLDRGQSRFLVIAPSGAIIEPRSIRRKGYSGSSSADQDFQEIDVHGLAYFLDRGRLLARLASGAPVADSAILLRFDATRQHADTVAMLRQSDKKVTQVDEHTQFSQGVHGSPQDGWGVASDGSVAVVRASPYQVEWYSPSGKISRGPSISFERLAFTDSEKAAITAARAKSGGSVGTVGGPQISAASQGELFAQTKTPFDPNGIIVSPDAHVWVPRTQRASVTTVLYDVFDKRGERTDRIELPPRSRVIGFGKSAAYVVERDDRGTPSLRKYKLNDAAR